MNNDKDGSLLLLGPGGMFQAGDDKFPVDRAPYDRAIHPVTNAFSHGEELEDELPLLPLGKSGARGLPNFPGGVTEGGLENQTQSLSSR